MKTGDMISWAVYEPVDFSTWFIHEKIDLLLEKVNDYTDGNDHMLDGRTIAPRRYYNVLVEGKVVLRCCHESEKIT